jgi:hypothetical protein
MGLTFLNLNVANPNDPEQGQTVERLCAVDCNLLHMLPLELPTGIAGAVSSPRPF